MGLKCVCLDRDAMWVLGRASDGLIPPALQGFPRGTRGGLRCTIKVWELRKLTFAPGK